MHGLAFDDACNAQLNSIALKAAWLCRLTDKQCLLIRWDLNVTSRHFGERRRWQFVCYSTLYS